MVYHTLKIIVTYCFGGSNIFLDYRLITINITIITTTLYGWKLLTHIHTTFAS